MNTKQMLEKKIEVALEYIQYAKSKLNKQTVSPTEVAMHVHSVVMKVPHGVKSKSFYQSYGCKLSKHLVSRRHFIKDARGQLIIGFHMMEAKMDARNMENLTLLSTLPTRLISTVCYASVQHIIISLLEHNICETQGVHIEGKVLTDPLLIARRIKAIHMRDSIQYLKNL